MENAEDRRLRRLAQRQGYHLTKSRTDGTWIVVDDGNVAVYGAQFARTRPFANGATTDDVRAWLLVDTMP
jgi:hypothetical protein